MKKIIRHTLIATLLLAIACKSAQTRQLETEFRSLIAELHALKTNGDAEQAKYDRIAERLGIVLADANIVSDDDNKKLAAALLDKVAAANCAGNIEKLQNGTDVQSHYDLILSCNPSVLTARATLSGENLTFANGGATQGVEFTQGQSGELRSSFALAAAGAENIAVNPTYRGFDAYRLLNTKFSLNKDFALRMQDVNVALVPRRPGNTYANYADANQASADEVKQSDGDFTAEAEISQSGQFTLGAAYKGENFDLLYGHPNGVYAEGIGTSFTTVRIDGEDFRLGRESAPQNSQSEGKSISEYSLKDGAVTVRQILTPISKGKSAKVSVVYEIENNDAKSHRVGIRLMLDTWAGSNDGVPFLLPVGKSNQLFEEEVEFTPSASATWQTFDPTKIADNPDAEFVFLYNQMAGDDLTPPNRVAFAGWGSASASTWDYQVTEGRRITGDSAVIMWWNPRRIKPGEKTSIGTMLGIIIQKNEPTVFVSDTQEGYVTAYLYHLNESRQAQTLKYALRCDNCTISNEVAPITTRVEPGATYINSLFLHVNASDDASLRILETINGKSKSFNFPIELKPVWNRARALPIAAPQEAIPVHFFSKKKLQLRARLLSPDGKIIKTIRLKRHAWANGFDYRGTFTAPPGGDGAYTVEVYR